MVPNHPRYQLRYTRICASLYPIFAASAIPALQTQKFFAEVKYTCDFSVYIGEAA